MYLSANYTNTFFNLTSPENEKFMSELMEVMEIILFLTGISTMITMVLLFTKLYEQYEEKREILRLETIAINAQKENEERQARGEPVLKVPGHSRSALNFGFWCFGVYSVCSSTF